MTPWTSTYVNTLDMINAKMQSVPKMKAKPECCKCLAVSDLWASVEIIRWLLFVDKISTTTQSRVTSRVREIAIAFRRLPGNDVHRLEREIVHDVHGVHHVQRGRHVAHGQRYATHQRAGEQEQIAGRLPVNF